MEERYVRNRKHHCAAYLGERCDAALGRVRLDVNVADGSAWLQNTLETSRGAHETTRHQESVHLRLIARIVYRLERANKTGQERGGHVPSQKPHVGHRLQQQNIKL